MFRYGRMNRATYWLGLGLFVAAFIALSLLTAKPPQIAEIILIVFAIPRLHDIGMSGWWVGGVFLAEIALAVVALIALPPNTSMNAFGVFALVVVGLLIWLGAVAGDPNPNRYGDPPAGGVSAYPRQKNSV